MHKRFCAATALTLFLSFSPSANAQRLPATAIPTHYTLALTPDLKAATFSGVESIDVDVKAPANSITLNAIEIAFQSVTIDANGAQQTGTVSLDPGRQQATFTFPKTVVAGQATINIRYTGILNDELRGFYLTKMAKRNYAVTQLEPTDARRAFPCFDEPALKATFDVSLEIDAGDTAISNTAIVSDRPGPDAGKHTLVFGTSPKMSTYLVAFVVGDFKCEAGEQDGVALRVCATPDKVALAPFALDIARFTLHYYDTYFDIHFPLKKLDLIGVPDFEAGAMENFGAIIFREDLLLVDPKTVSVASQTVVASDITHEMAHQWFGDLVTLKWWDNVWLNEGFATWMENKPVAAMHPEWEIPQVAANSEDSTLNIDAQATTRAIRATADTPDEINQMFDGIAYGKAGDVLLMVENYLGEETFRKGVHAYLAAHEYGNATAEDFWNAQTAASHKPVDKIMESLVDQPGAPILSFGAPSGSKVSVTQKRFFLSPSIAADAKQKWTLPVCFKADGGLEDCRLLTPADGALKIPSSSIFFANADGKGFYRSAYAPGQYAALVDHVETGLTATERIRLEGDEWAQVRANKATVADYMNLVAALKSDPDSEVLSGVYGGLSAVADQIASTREERDALAAWIRYNFEPEYTKLGATAASDTSGRRQLRGLLFSLLAYRGNDDVVIREARKIADEYLADPTSVDATFGDAALAVAAKNGDAALFDKLENTYETSADPARKNHALQLLMVFNDKTLLNRALEYSVSSKVRKQDSAIQLAIGLQIPENRGQTWSFIKTHWDEVQAKFTTEMGSLLVRYTGSFCSADARDDVKSFFAAYPVTAADAALRHSIEHINGCIELRQLQEPNLKTWLAAQDSASK
jgi:aminopeptidase N/puromycin-sensitive aminopeptidase